MRSYDCCHRDATLPWIVFGFADVIWVEQVEDRSLILVEKIGLALGEDSPYASIYSCIKASISSFSVEKHILKASFRLNWYFKILCGNQWLTRGLVIFCACCRTLIWV